MQVPCCVRIIGSSVHDENTIDAIFQIVDQPVEEFFQVCVQQTAKAMVGVALLQNNHMLVLELFTSARGTGFSSHDDNRHGEINCFVF